MKNWSLSVPFPLRFLFASNPKVMTRVLGIVYRDIAIAGLPGFAGPAGRIIRLKK